MDSSSDSTPISLSNQSNGTIHDINHDPPRSTKGFGLRKWRRIPRNNHVSPKAIEISDKDKDRDSDSDSTAGRFLKRGSSNIASNGDNDNINNNPLGSINDSSTAIFNAGIDSDYSEDRSSTAASAPKNHHHHHHNHHLREKNKMKNSSVKNFSNQRLVLNSKSMNDSSKKAKEVKEFEKENSPISSFESDSRSCNPNFGGGCGELHSVEEQPNPVDFSSDRLSSSVNQGKSKEDDDQVTGDDDDDDPLVDSILLLQSAQLALQAEVQKFGEIGKGIRSLYDDSDKTNGVAFDSVLHMGNGSMRDSCNGNGDLNNNVQTLERQLNEAECSLKEKESRISELEMTLKSMESTQNHVKNTIEDQYKTRVEMEAELHVLFRRKLEAEVISLVMTSSIKDSKDHSKKEVVSPKKVVSLENNDGHTLKSDAFFTGKEIQDMHRRVKKLTKCFFIQLILLLLVVTLFFFQLAPKPEVVVPT